MSDSPERKRPTTRAQTIRKKNKLATKIQSNFRGYNRRKLTKLTNTMKANSSRFFTRTTKQDRLIKIPMILKRMFNKSHEGKYGTSHNARDEVGLIMDKLESIRVIQERAYEMKILSLIYKIKEKLAQFNGTTEEKKARVYYELEELRHLFIIPYNDFIDNQNAVDNGEMPNTKVTDSNLYNLYILRGWRLEAVILHELGSIFPPETLLARGRQIKKHTRKIHKKRF
jgi:hypothetical protein